ncbi:MAG TPA: sigma-70 family RNA polymerase sigma factor [Planctomycetota bacterium]|jgi:RNA polymerase sigma factor (TIGR02999 family)|nr:sigma-70 family RNA polymerase sigma factor [Planctomycetota bacterium]
MCPAPDPASGEVTLLLARAGQGDADATARLLELVYAELRDLAGGYARGQRAGHTLQPTALVHEAFLKLVHGGEPAFGDRAHFLAVAATAMRQILTDHARARAAQKRGGAWEKVSLSDLRISAENDEIDLLALDDALAKLSAFDPRKHRVVELRFFGGLTVEEVARVLDLSTTTVESEWRAARAWLAVRLSGT